MIKKLPLFLGLALFSAVAVQAEVKSTIYPHLYSSGISPDGRWGVSEVYGEVYVIDLLDGTMYSVGEEVTGGAGPSISNTGWLVCSDPTDTGLIFKEGNIRILDPEASEKYSMTLPMSITADGRRVVGEVSNPDNKDGLMTIPCYWDMNGDGTVKELVMLPHPDVDFTGRAPQYVTAIGVSDDGKVIIGQVVDYSGSFPMPIIYTQNAMGEWKYETPFEDLINPDHLVFPEDPGDGPEAPLATDYMNDEQRQEYQDALEYYWNNGYQPEDEPVLSDYMTPEAIEEYNAAVAKYNEEAISFNEKLEAFYSVFEKVYETAVMFTFNNILISPDGKTAAAGCEIPGESFWDPSINYTMIFNLDGYSYKELPKDKNVYPVQLFDGGVMMGTNGTAMGGLPPQSYIKVPENEDFVALEEYLAKADPEMATWMDENLKKEVEFYDAENDTFYTDEYLFTGLVYANPDLTNFWGGVQCYYWPEEECPEGAMFLSYYLSRGESGVKGIVSAAADVTLDVNGNLNVSDEAKGVKVYDLQGRLLFSADKGGAVATGLGKGIYVVAVEYADGVRTSKVNL